MANVNREGLPPIAGMSTFAAGGGLTHTDSNILGGAGFAAGGASTYGPSHGTWASSGGRAYEYRWVRLVFDASGAYIGTNRTRGRITLDEDGNGYTSESVGETLNLQGEVLSSTRNTGRSIRMMIEPDS